MADSSAVGRVTLEGALRVQRWPVGGDMAEPIWWYGAAPHSPESPSELVAVSWESKDLAFSSRLEALPVCVKDDGMLAVFAALVGSVRSIRLALQGRRAGSCWWWRMLLYATTPGGIPRWT